MNAAADVYVTVTGYLIVCPECGYTLGNDHDRDTRTMNAMIGHTEQCKYRKVTLYVRKMVVPAFTEPLDG